jgi:hypothetical protein
VDDSPNLPGFLGMATGGGCTAVPPRFERLDSWLDAYFLVVFLIEFGTPIFRTHDTSSLAPRLFFLQQVIPGPLRPANYKSQSKCLQCSLFASYAHLWTTVVIGATHRTKMALSQRMYHGRSGRSTSTNMTTRDSSPKFLASCRNASSNSKSPPFSHLSVSDRVLLMPCCVSVRDRWCTVNAICSSGRSGIAMPLQERTRDTL